MGFLLRNVARENFFSQNFLKQQRQLRNNNELEIATSNYLPFRLESLALIAAIFRRVRFMSALLTIYLTEYGTKWELTYMY